MNSNKTIRLRTTPGESQNIQFKIEQEFDTLNILSLKITQDEVYRNFCSDYGVIVGRVIANDGFGVENAKISVFIPVSNEDQDDPIISSIYPYTTVSDSDIKGVRYNLLPKQGKKYTHYQTFPIGVNPNDDIYNYQQPFKGSWVSSSWVLETTNSDGTSVYSREALLTYGPDVPTGTFPSKQEFLDNDILLEVYEKYYKLTTKTNGSGDYMLFGVPVGSQTLHMDVDLSDSGQVSLTVEDFIDAGYPQQLFDITNNKFLSSTNIDSLPQIESRDVSVEVVPFWGDLDQCEIGITRLDFNLNKTVTPSAILIFQAFTNADDSLAINKVNCNIDSGNENEFTAIGNMKKIGVKVVTTSVNSDFTKTESFEGGNVFVTLPMYEEKYITDEFGNYVLSPDQNKGIPTGGRYYFNILPTSNFISTEQLNSDSEGKGYACYITNKWETFGIPYGSCFYSRYDLKNKKRKIYTFGNYNSSSNGLNRVTSIRGLESGSNIKYPVSTELSNEPRFGQTTGNIINACYGSLYFPRLEWKGNNGGNSYCLEVAKVQDTHEPTGLTYKSLYIDYEIGNVTDLGSVDGFPYYMDITDVIKLFKEFGGGIQVPTSCNLGLYNDENSNPIGSDVNGINNQTIPLRNSTTNSNLYFPLTLNTDQKPYDNTVRQFSLFKSYIGPGINDLTDWQTHTGRYFFYFGLKENDNALTYLKERLGE
jgi:hypothetical protein